MLDRKENKKLDNVIRTIWIVVGALILLGELTLGVGNRELHTVFTGMGIIYILAVNTYILSTFFMCCLRKIASYKIKQLKEKQELEKSEASNI